MKWRVAFVSVVPSPYQRDLFAALAARPEIELHVFYLEHAAPDSPWPGKTLRPFERVMPGFWFSLGNARVHLNWRLPDAREFDLVVMNSLMSLTAQRLMRGALASRRWMFWGERLGGRGGWHDRLSAPLQRAAGIAAIGSLAEADYRARFPAVRTWNIPYHCDLAPFRAQPQRSRDSEVVFLMCGQMIARKGVDVLLSAFARLERGRLLLVGREAELPQMLTCVPAEVRARIEFVGFQAPEELPRFFARADVFVLPSRHDGWGVVVNQALGAGLPILCSDRVGAAHDLVRGEGNGLTFAAGDAEALRAGMQRMISEPELIDRWGAASRAMAADWSPEAGAAKWMGAIAEVLA